MIKPNDRNVWQKFATSTNGIATPGNFITIAGAILTIYGLLLLLDAVSLNALLLIALGRIADILDGIAADLTGTKSPLGEILDAGIDKVLMLIAAIVLLISGFMPMFIIVAIAVQNIYNGAISIIAKARKIELHPTLSGKISVAISWVILFLYAIPELESMSPGALNLTQVITAITLVIYLILAFKSSYDYTKTTFTIGKVR